MSRAAVWKYPLEITDEQTLHIPGFSKALSVQTQKDVLFQKDVLCLWVIANADEPSRAVGVRIVGTGCRFFGIPQESFVGTVQTNNGALVWHVFVG